MGLRHFLTLADLSTSELQALIKRGIEIKSGLQKGELYQPLQGKVLAMIFEYLRNHQHVRVCHLKQEWRNLVGMQFSCLQRERNLVGVSLLKILLVYCRTWSMSL